MSNANEVPKRFENADVLDLSKLGGTPSGGTGGGAGVAPVAIDLTEENFQQVMEQSARVPVVVELTVTYSEQCRTVHSDLVALAKRRAGAFLLATVDMDTSKQLAAAFQAQSAPAIFGVLAGQLVPFPPGAPNAEQLGELVDQLLKLAKENGVTGAVTGEESAPPPLPPLHAKGMAALESGDLAGAREAFEAALKENPGDSDAKAVLAQIALLERTDGADLPAVVVGAAPGAAGQMAAADAEMALGRGKEALDRLIAAIRVTFGPEREELRLRILDYFLILGDEDPAVLTARRALASALY